MRLLRTALVLLSSAVVLLAGCSSDQTVGERSDAGAGGAGSTLDSGKGAAAGDNGSTVVCQSSSLSVAPGQCQDVDWTHTVHTYPRTCGVTLGAYQATCGNFDTVIDIGPATETWCFYSRDTGNLTASRQIGKDGTKCLTFDVDVTVPDVATCAPVSGGECSDASP